MMNSRPLTALCKRNGLTLTELAARLSRSRHTVKKWGVEVEIPADEVRNIVLAFGGAVLPHELRPDVFGPDQPPPPGASGPASHAAE